MRKTFVWGVPAIIFIALIGWQMTYTVRFNEAAVVTFLGDAGENAVQDEPGLKFKVPFLQSATTYDTRARFLDTPAAQVVQTADESQVLVRAFMTWRVSDPLKFFQRFGGSGSRESGHYNAAKDQLTRRLQAALSQVSSYRLDELLSADGTRLVDLEADLLDAISSSSVNEGLDAIGIEAIMVGISELKFPSDTTREVFNRMTAERAGKAAIESSRGTSTARAIETRAASEANIIEQFANQRAAAIVAEGQKEAGAYLAQMTAGEDSEQRVKLALFLESVEMLRDVVGRNLTMVVSTTNPVLRLLDPDVAAEIDRGENPSDAFYESIRAATGVDDAEGAQ